MTYKQQWEDGEGVFQSQDKIEKELLDECLKTGEALLKDIFKDHEPLIQCVVLIRMVALIMIKDVENFLSMKLKYVQQLENKKVMVKHINY